MMRHENSPTVGSLRFRGPSRSPLNQGLLKSVRQTPLGQGCTTNLRTLSCFRRSQVRSSCSKDGGEDLSVAGTLTSSKNFRRNPAEYRLHRPQEIETACLQKVYGVGVFHKYHPRFARYRLPSKVSPAM